jgi:hypothetical protein
MKDRGRGGVDEDSITFVITSCGRFDLLQECLASFFAYNTAPINRYLLVEDSGDHRVHDVIAKFDVPMEVIVNDPPVGQIAAIDRAYHSVTTPYIFHCEDDWRFFRSGFIEESLLLLKHIPKITAVLCRRPGQNLSIDRIFLKSPLQSLAHVHYRIPSPCLVPDWLGYSFNPGLRRLSDYELLGSFSKRGHEIDASLYFKLRGRMVAVLDDPACETSGRERRLPKQAAHRSLRARMQSIGAKWRYQLTNWLDFARMSERPALDRANALLFADRSALRAINADDDIGPVREREEIHGTGTMPDDGLFVGFNWHDLEVDAAGTRWRWIDGDAQVVITRPSGLRRRIVFDLAPGPGISSLPCRLHVRDSAGAVVSEVSVAGRGPVAVNLPVVGGVGALFSLGTEDGGCAIRNDPRILNFRVFSFRWDND